MVWLKSALICVVILVVVSQAEVVQINRDIAKAFLDEHNVARAAVKVPPLKWNENLRKSAQNWAAQCKWKHSDNDNGENLYASYPRSTFYTELAGKTLKGWVSEKKFVTEDWACAFRSKDSCGHYSQVVWKNTKTVGCAIAHCGDKLANFVVCQYSPPGNYNGQKPY